MNKLYMNKIIHQIFLDIGLKPLDERKDYLENIEITKKLNPDWKHMLWLDSDVEELVKLDYPEILDMWNNFPNKFYKVDFVRYLILNKYGGIYLDLDEQCIKPFDDKFCNSKTILGKWIKLTNNKEIINNNIIGFQNKEICKKLIDYSISQYEYRQKSMPESWKVRKFLHSVGATMFFRFCKINKISSDIDSFEYIKQKKSKDGQLSWILAFNRKIDYNNIHNKII